MSAVSVDRWQEAQAAERAYWEQADRFEEAQRASWYAGLLQLTPAVGTGNSVTEIACGPQGLVLGDWNIERAFAVDPMRYARADEAAYVEADVDRVYEPAETYAGVPTDEVWGANVLQHVMDPVQVIRTVQRLALSVVRWFDWVETPVTTVHPHSLRADWLDGLFRDWRCVWRVDGTAQGERWQAQRFLARVWVR